MQIQINNRIIKLAEGDITDLDTDAIVNAANSWLQLGSGVAGAIRRRGGRTIQKECNDIGYCPVGGAVITGGGNLKARYVIHAVGPRGHDQDADTLLASATRSSLGVAVDHGLESIAFPAISTGVFGYPIERCARIMLNETMDFLRQEPTSLTMVVFCLYGQAAFEVFAEILAELTE